MRVKGRTEESREKKLFAARVFAPKNPGIALRFRERYDTIPLNYVIAWSRYTEFIRQNVNSVIFRVRRRVVMNFENILI